MWLLARTKWYLASRFLADPGRSDGLKSNQNTARTNAAAASATMQEQRRENDDVEAYLRAWHLRHPPPPPATGSGGAGSKHVI